MVLISFVYLEGAGRSAGVAGLDGVQVEGLSRREMMSKVESSVCSLFFCWYLD